jgi:hypothetical protein
LETLQTASYIWIGIGIVTMLVLLFTKIRAPYGRHSRPGWGSLIPNKWGWFFMELPALVIMPTLAIFGPREKDVLSWLLIALWMFHYANRTLVFPFRLRTQRKKMPLSIVLSAVFFNGINGGLNGFYVGFFGAPDADYLQLNVVLGLVLFSIGMAINWVADAKLIALRKQDSGYQTPNGWLFTYISCPNHFGEMLEWIGFALMAWNIPALSFAIWTFCDLLPRSLNHQAWYREHFPDYPKNRKAVIPFLV